MLKVTVDTNILVSAVISKGNEYRLLRLAKEDKIELVLSVEILYEFKEVISRSKFGFSRKQVEDIIKQIFTISSIVIPTVKLKVVEEDPDDDMVIECAVSGKVDFIVSGDKHLLNLKRFGNIKILKTSDLLNIIDSG